ncbi:glycosyltransferase family 2 protein [Kordiimonas gwangyangensis]|uniref:glycosyltransferase family 2 protein n=1 Tax=Kordiimonas gwangyangensis TaxID=288022 RepID=UPI0009DD6BD4
MTVSISAVVCTHNRAEELEACLRSLCECPSVALAEVIVVDNASTDRTRLVAADYADRMPALCYVYEQAGAAVCKKQRLARCKQ